MAENLPYGLHIPTGKPNYKYDFRVRGVRYSRSVKTANKREAIRLASQAHAKIEAGETTKIEREEITLRQFFGRFFEEAGKHEKNAATIKGQCKRLARRLGPNKLLSKLTVNDLLKYQQKRREEVAPRTVNGELVDLMRRAIKRAKHWNVERGELASPDFEWTDLQLEAPPDRNRHASRDEQARLLRSLRKDYRPLVLFALLTGLRRSALLVKKDQIDWVGRRIRYQKKSKKTNDTAWLPMTPRIERLIRHQCSLAPESEFVFTYKAWKTLGGREKGRRYPITYSGMAGQMKQAVKKAGLKDWRLFHDLRHTAATETLKASKDIMSVRDMLAHSTVRQTEKYAHVLDEDVRSAMTHRRVKRVA